jgi:hypothetical protein
MRPIVNVDLSGMGRPISHRDRGQTYDFLLFHSTIRIFIIHCIPHCIPHWELHTDFIASSSDKKFLAVLRALPNRDSAYSTASPVKKGFNFFSEVEKSVIWDHEAPYAFLWIRQVVRKVSACWLIHHVKIYQLI